MLLRLLRVHLAGRGRRVAALVALQLLQCLASLLVPTLGAVVIDRGLFRGDLGAVAVLGAAVFGLALAQAVTWIGAVRLGTGLTTAVGHDLRARLFRHVLALPTREVSRIGAGSLVTRTVNDVTQIERFGEMAAATVVVAPALCAGAVALAMTTDLVLGLLVCAMLPVATTVTVLVLRRTDPLYRAVQRGLDRLGVVVGDRMRGVRVIRALGRDDHERRRFAETDERLLRLNRRVGHLVGLILPLVLLISNVFTALVIGVAGVRAQAGEVLISSVSAFVGYLGLVLLAMIMVVFLALAVPRAAACADRIQEVLDRPTDGPPAVAAAPPVAALAGGGRTAVALSGIGVGLGARPILAGIDLAVESGEVVALVGPTGSGKTTLLDTLASLVTPDTGVARLHGVELAAMAPATRARTVAHVPSQPVVFTGTIASNLRLGRPEASDQELWDALDVAGLRPTVEAFEGGLQTPLSRGGRTLSGGQRQRLGLARALTTRPAVYLLDDCFSALDATTARAVRSAFATSSAAATVLMAAQSPGDAGFADRVLGIEAGRLVTAPEPARRARPVIAGRVDSEGVRVTLTLVDLRSGGQVGRVETTDGRFRMTTPGAGAYLLVARGAGRRPIAERVLVGHRDVHMAGLALPWDTSAPVRLDAAPARVGTDDPRPSRPAGIAPTGGTP